MGEGIYHGLFQEVLTNESFCLTLCSNFVLQGSPDLKRPPPLSRNNLDLYDSCVDDVNNPSIYVVFERDQCYPRYLISYTTGGKKKETL